MTKMIMMLMLSAMVVNVQCVNNDIIRQAQDDMNNGTNGTHVNNVRARGV